MRRLVLAVFLCVGCGGDQVDLPSYSDDTMEAQTDAGAADASKPPTDTGSRDTVEKPTWQCFPDAGRDEVQRRARDKMTGQVVVTPGSAVSLRECVDSAFEGLICEYQGSFPRRYCVWSPVEVRGTWYLPCECPQTEEEAERLREEWCQF